MERIAKTIRILGLPAILIVSAFLIIAILGGFLSPYDPNAQNLMNINESFSWAHPLGTDHLGRDTLSRLIAGAQTTLIGVTIILLIAGCVGLVIGTISGYF